MVEAARKYNRVVQTGSQQRSAPHFQKVVGMIQSGRIGKVTMVECWNSNNDTPQGIGNLPDSDPPAGMDWDMYLGPAPKVPYNRYRFIWRYRWFWDRRHDDRLGRASHGRCPMGDGSGCSQVCHFGRRKVRP